MAETLSTELSSDIQTRRTFLAGASHTVVGSSILTGFSTIVANEAGSRDANALPRSEMLVLRLYESLSEHQKNKVVKPYDHPLRSRVESSWHIIDERVGDLFDRSQQLLIREIFMSLHSPEFRNKTWDQFVHDNKTSKAKTPDDVFATASIAIFATPNLDKVEFVFTGRHCTRRCDGNAQPGTAFGGPMFYGHAAGGYYEKPEHPGNVYWFQAKQVNELYQKLEADQQKKAVLENSRGEDGTRTVSLRDKGFEGLATYDMSPEQRKELLRVIEALLLPFREEDRMEALRMIEAQITELYLTFYRKEDVGEDGIWDTWQIEGPSMLWYFRGAPHVHCWVHVKEPALA